MKRFVILASAVCAFVFTAHAQDEVPHFKEPAPIIKELAMSSPVPSKFYNPQYSQAVLASRKCRAVPLAELAGPEERIGGERFNPVNFSASRVIPFERIEIMNLTNGQVIEVAGLPEGARIDAITWSPSGRYFAFTHSGDSEVSIYRVDAAAARPEAVKISSRKVNSTLGRPFAFLDDDHILYKSVPDGIGQKPERGMSKWPVVQENLKGKKSIRTYQDLLSSPYDEQIYDYCTSSVLAMESPEGCRLIGEKAIYRSYRTSPDGKYIMVTTEHRPYSYIQTHNSFPSKQYIIDLDGKVVKMLNDGTKKDDSGKDNKDKKEKKSKGPKPAGFEWRADQPATLVWREVSTPEKEKVAKDSTASKDSVKVKEPSAVKKEKKEKPEYKYTNKVYQCQAPFNFETDKQIVLSAEYRISGPILWSGEKLAFFTESSSKEKFGRLSSFVPCDTMAGHKVLVSYSTEVDTLGNFPVYGLPYMVQNAYGREVVWTDAKAGYIYMKGNDRPDADGFKTSFIDRLSLKDGKTVNVWTAGSAMLEKVVGITNFKNLAFLETKEDYTTVPDIWETSIKGRKISSRQISHFENPVPQIKDLVTRQYVSYTRKDGLKCYANLYLPAGYDKEKDGRLPVFMWTYPYEYKCFAECEKDRTARNNFVKPTYGSAMIWATQGFAVLDGFTMAIIAEQKDSLPNNRFLPQMIMSAEAAVDFVCDSTGIGDRNRIGVGGHSYGAYMTANLLNHTRLFKAGIARSGGYNRSLTPFGFQHERRSYWEAQEMYNKMSPFNYAHQMKDAMLLIHGQMDANMGTFPVQSQRLYDAYVYNGCTVRYLQMPYESHSYYGIETTLDMLYETGAWLDKYVKNAQPEKKSQKAEK